jgi:hypothetical protein
MQQEQENKKQKQKGDNEFQVCHPLCKNKETKGATTSKKTNTPKAREGKFVNGIGQWNELL